MYDDAFLSDKVALAGQRHEEAAQDAENKVCDDNSWSSVIALSLLKHVFGEIFVSLSSAMFMISQCIC